MEDRYLYKAKRTDNGEWVTGYILKDGVTGQTFIHAVGNSVNESDKVGEEGCLRFLAFEVDSSTLCQCTGLKDKNGRLIWENDIILAGYYKWKCKVVWDEACVRFIGLTNDKDVKIVYVDMVDRSNESAVEVIGNIIDNPELLEV